MIFLRIDLKNIMREPILMVIFMLPLLLLLVLTYVVPVVAVTINNYFGFELMKYRTYIYYFFLMVVPMSMGMVWAFLLIDERDEKILEFINISPVGTKKHLMNKLVTATAAAFILSLPLYLLAGERSLKTFMILILIAVEAPYMILAVGAFARDKVEAMALAKLFNLTYIVPIASIFIEGKTRYLLAVFPQFYIFQLFGADKGFAGIYILGTAVHMGAGYLIYKVYSKRSLV